MTPRNRTELVEVMARAMCVERYPISDPDEITYITDDGVKQPYGPARAWDVPAAEAALTALENAGCVVVPREATEEMEAAHYDAHVKSKMVMADVPEIWTAMLSASPYVKENG